MQTKERRQENAQPQEQAEHIHLPDPSYWPIILAFGVAVIAVGVIFNFLIAPIGLIIMLAGLIGWLREPF